MPTERVILKVIAEKAGIAPAFFWLFFFNGLLYKAHNRPRLLVVRF
jgi:hypothetical protein